MTVDDNYLDNNKNESIKNEKNFISKNLFNFFKLNIEIIFIFISIPFYLLLNYYFLNKENRNLIENILLIFSIMAFFIFSYSSFIKVRNFVSLSNIDINEIISKKIL